MADQDQPADSRGIYTVTVTGPERHDGEAPFTYVLPAAARDNARALAWAYHVVAWDLEPAGAMEWGVPRPDAYVVDRPGYTFDGAPDWPADTPGRGWTDLRAPEQQRFLAGAVRTALDRHAVGLLGFGGAARGILGRVALDGLGPLDAMISHVRNGAAVPRFERAEAERIMRHCDPEFARRHAAVDPAAYEVLCWDAQDPDVILIIAHDRPGAPPTVERLEPCADGRWPIGAFAWPWRTVQD